MRTRTLYLIILAAGLLLAPTAATAAFPHTVQRGESLSSIAAADGLTVSQLAAANGLSSASQLVSGTTVMIPPQTSSSSSVLTSPATTAPAVSSSVVGDGDGDADDVGVTAAAEPASTASSASAGSYVVQPGDTLSAIAARAGTTVAQLAVSNGLDPNGLLPSGSVLRLGGSGSTVAGTAVPVSMTTISSTASAEAQPVGTAAQGNVTDPPYPTPERVSASEVGQIAAANGVPASLAQAIGWQESGFNNALVSSADARGVMQILPGTWDWINRTLTGGATLAPASAASNVRGGVLLLHSLLNSTGGDPAMAAAGYFQGLSSVQRHGLYQSTQNYVNNVLALRRSFGGG